MSGMTLVDYVRVLLTGSLYALVTFWIVSTVSVGLLLVHTFLTGRDQSAHDRPDADG